MKTCVELLLANGSVNPDLTQNLRENPYFRVIAVLGRGQRKISVLNSLLGKNADVFQGPGKGTQMFITKDRQIILNVHPLSSKHKLGREGEADLITLYLSLLKVCHTVIFVEADMEARNDIRLLRFSELMDFGYEKLGLNMEFQPNIIFLADQWTTTTIGLFQCLLKGSRLQDNVHLMEKCESDTLLFKNLTKLAYRSPRTTMSMMALSLFTELHWYQVVQGLWKLHKTNYFLVKYVR